MEMTKISVVARGRRRGEISRQSTENFYSKENTLYIIIMDICHYTVFQTH